jgi:hypothetical protein
VASESPRTSPEARFRVQAPNSTPRSTRVIALDEAGEAVVRRLSSAAWRNATFSSAAGAGVGHIDTGISPGPAQPGVHNGFELRDLKGTLIDLREAIETADLVVMIAGPGGHAHAARSIGQACRGQAVMTTALVLDADTAEESALSLTLAQLRPWAWMVVVAKGDGYVDDILGVLCRD